MLPSEVEEDNEDGDGLRTEKGNLTNERKNPGKKAQAKRRTNKQCKAGEFERLVVDGGIFSTSKLSCKSL